jgi:DNA modification methylase
MSGSCPSPAYTLDDPRTEVHVGDCRAVLGRLPAGFADLAVPDPPFNFGEPYGGWDDRLPRADYERFTYEWLDGCVRALAPHGALWPVVPDHIAAEVVIHLKGRGLELVNWVVWHFRFGVWRDGSFIVSKVHLPYFVKGRRGRRWNPGAVLVPSDRGSRYADPRTRRTRTPGLRVPLDVWGADGAKFWGRVQGNNRERRPAHPNQLAERLLERIIRATSDPGDLVLDPFLGSGTTCTVARALGRRSLGIELNPAFAASAFERIKAGPIRVTAVGRADRRGTALRSAT